MKKIFGALIMGGICFFARADHFIEDSLAYSCTPEASKIIINIAQVEVANCPVVDRGSIAFTIMGGIPPYGVALTGGVTEVPPLSDVPQGISQSFAGLGTSEVPYVIVATDAEGVSESSGTIVLSPVYPMDFVISSTPTSCFCGNDGSLSLMVTDAIEPSAAILIDSGNKVVATIKNMYNGEIQTVAPLCAGLYSLTIIDDKGCSLTLPVNVREAEGQPIKINMRKKGRQIRIKVTGGAPPYSYQLDEGDVVESGSSYVFECLKKGKHILTVKDANGCMKCAKVFLLK